MKRLCDKCKWNRGIKAPQEEFFTRVCFHPDVPPTPGMPLYIITGEITECSWFESGERGGWVKEVEDEKRR